MDAIVKAEVKLSEQQMKHYEALLAVLRRRSVKVGERIREWAHAGIYILISMFLAGLLVWHIIANTRSILDVIEFIVSVSIVLTGIHVRYKPVKRERNVIPQKKEKRKATEYSILFFPDTIHVSSIYPDEYMNRDYPYDRYVKASECEDAFLLHAGREKEFIIPKSSIIEGTPEGLFHHLREKLGDRFRLETE